MNNIFKIAGATLVVLACVFGGPSLVRANLEIVPTLPVNVSASASVSGSSVTISVSGGLSGYAGSEECFEDVNPGGPSYNHWYTDVGTQTVPANTAQITSGVLSSQTIPLSVTPGQVGNDCFTDPGETGSFSGSRTFTNVAAGSHTVNIRVTDDRGQVGNRSVSFTVAAASVPPTCSASASNIDIGENVTFTGANGSSYTWSASGGSPSSGSGNTFSTSYTTAGTKTVTVTSGDQSGTCSVAVSAPSATTPSCAPASQTATVGVPAALSATGGTSGTYTWSTTGASSATPSGTNNANVSVTYTTAGTKNVTVSRNGVTSAVCTVSVVDTPTPLPTLTLSAAPNPVAVNGTPTLTWTVSNAQTCTDSPDRWYWNGPFDASDGVHSSSSVQPHTVAGETRNYTMTCSNSSGSVTRSVDVATESPSATTPSCAPASQTATVGVPAALSATGGTSGTYTWSTTGASSATPSGTNNANVSVTYTTAGTKNVTVSRNGVTSAVCTVSVVVAPPPTTPVCSPSSQNATVGVPVTLTATGGTSGDYFWTATGASPKVVSGIYNSNISVTYATAGTKNVRVLRNGVSSSWCSVVVADVPPATGTIVVNSNRPTTWSVTGAQDLVQSTPATTATYTGVPVATYIMSAAQLPGYSLVITPSTSQQLNAGGTRTFTLTYTPNTAGVVLSANPTSVQSGATAVLTWVSNGIVSGSCVGSGAWSGSKVDNGSQSTGALTSDSMFTITCNVPSSGTVQDTATVSVLVATPPGDDDDNGGGKPQCSDATDNDGDGRIDFGSDPECVDAEDNLEAALPPPPPGDDDDVVIGACNDGFDNDGDGTIDEADSGCESGDGTEQSEPDIREI